MAVAVRKRADGEASRERILEAAAQLAGERGYRGTSISAVSERSGLPASSIYWHFTDKDDLIAAVIDRSFRQWIEALEGPIHELADAQGQAHFLAAMRHVGTTLDEFGDFLRLGIMLILDRSPSEPTARAKFIDVREATRDRIRALYLAVFADLEREQIEDLTTLTLVMADGTFIAREADRLNRDAAYDLMATAILGTASYLRRH
jgi:AcrR family transcriptional regulator